jgi:HPr kinase/phosphorylase
VRAPATIGGLIELRGVGIVRLEPLPEAPLALIVELVAPDAVERLPERRAEPIFGLAVPLIEVAPFEASAAAKVRLALRTFTGPGLPAIIGQ